MSLKEEESALSPPLLRVGSRSAAGLVGGGGSTSGSAAFPSSPSGVGVATPSSPSATSRDGGGGGGGGPSRGGNSVSSGNKNTSSCNSSSSNKNSNSWTTAASPSQQAMYAALLPRLVLHSSDHRTRSLLVGVSSLQGWRDSMEDAHCVHMATDSVLDHDAVRLRRWRDCHQDAIAGLLFESDREGDEEDSDDDGNDGGNNGCRHPLPSAGATVSAGASSTAATAGGGGVGANSGASLASSTCSHSLLPRTQSMSGSGFGGTGAGQGGLGMGSSPHGHRRPGGPSGPVTSGIGSSPQRLPSSAKLTLHGHSAPAGRLLVAGSPAAGGGVGALPEVFSHEPLCFSSHGSGAVRLASSVNAATGHNGAAASNRRASGAGMRSPGSSPSSQSTPPTSFPPDPLFGHHHHNHKDRHHHRHHPSSPPQHQHQQHQVLSNGCVYHNQAESATVNINVFGVFDGHGGREVADIVGAHIAEWVHAAPGFERHLFERALHEAFTTEDERMRRQWAEGTIMGTCPRAGCTANVVMIVERSSDVVTRGLQRAYDALHQHTHYDDGAQDGPEAADADHHHLDHRDDQDGEGAIGGGDGAGFGGGGLGLNLMGGSVDGGFFGAASVMFGDTVHSGANSMMMSASSATNLLRAPPLASASATACGAQKKNRHRHNALLHHHTLLEDAFGSALSGSPGGGSNAATSAGGPGTSTAGVGGGGGCGGRASAGTKATLLASFDEIKIICANAGDSRAFMTRVCGIVVPLSHDHKPSQPLERERIRNARGHVSTDESGISRIDHILAVSRGFGDFSFKSDEKLLPERQRVVATPEVRMTWMHRDILGQCTFPFCGPPPAALEGSDAFVAALNGAHDMISPGAERLAVTHNQHHSSSSHHHHQRHHHDPHHQNSHSKHSHSHTAHTPPALSKADQKAARQLTKALGWQPTAAATAGTAHAGGAATSPGAMSTTSTPASTVLPSVKSSQSLPTTVGGRGGCGGGGSPVSASAFPSTPQHDSPESPALSSPALSGYGAASPFSSGHGHYDPFGPGAEGASPTTPSGSGGGSGAAAAAESFMRALSTANQHPQNTAATGGTSPPPPGNTMTASQPTGGAASAAPPRGEDALYDPSMLAAPLFCVLACDGLWDSLSNTAASAIILAKLDEQIDAAVRKRRRLLGLLGHLPDDSDTDRSGASSPFGSSAAPAHALHPDEHAAENVLNADAGGPVLLLNGLSLREQRQVLNGVADEIDPALLSEAVISVAFSLSYGLGSGRARPPGPMPISTRHDPAATHHANKCGANSHSDGEGFSFFTFPPSMHTPATTTTNDETRPPPPSSQAGSSPPPPLTAATTSCSANRHCSPSALIANPGAAHGALEPTHLRPMTVGTDNMTAIVVVHRESIAARAAMRHAAPTSIEV